jgi:preprotein translocase subunit SecA
VLARTTFPRFFQRYVKLCGSATSLRALATEIHSTYGLSVQSIPTRQPSRQRLAPDQVFLDQASKWQAICERVREQHKTGQPVLVATHNSADTELLGRLLTTAGVPHQVSEADNWDKGTQQRSRAGVAGAVTISTAQSSHSLDIQLDSQARELGGLYVILTERCRAARLDVRLLGHCARRGEPGTGVAMLSLEDQLAEAQLPFWLRSLLQRNRLAGAAQALRVSVVALAVLADSLPPSGEVGLAVRHRVEFDTGVLVREQPATAVALRAVEVADRLPVAGDALVLTHAWPWLLGLTSGHAHEHQAAEA